MSTKRPRTTGDLLRFNCALKVDCTNCGACKTLTGHEALNALGLVNLSTVAGRLRCSRCRAKQAKIAVLPPV